MIECVRWAQIFYVFTYLQTSLSIEVHTFLWETVFWLVISWETVLLILIFWPYICSSLVFTCPLLHKLTFRHSHSNKPINSNKLLYFICLVLSDLTYLRHISWTTCNCCWPGTKRSVEQLQTPPWRATLLKWGWLWHQCRTLRRRACWFVKGS